MPTGLCVTVAFSATVLTVECGAGGCLHGGLSGRAMLAQARSPGFHFMMAN